MELPGLPTSAAQQEGLINASPHAKRRSEIIVNRNVRQQTSQSSGENHETDGPSVPARRPTRKAVRLGALLAITGANGIADLPSASPPCCRWPPLGARSSRVRC